MLLRNEYQRGRLVAQTFADGSTYTYSYYPEDSEPIRKVAVHTPDGRIFDLDVLGWYSSIRERDTRQ